MRARNSTLEERLSTLDDSLSTLEALAHSTEASSSEAGLTPSELSQLPRRPAEPSMASDVCAICLDAFEESHTLVWLACCHAFHDACACRWLANKPHCPLCKAHALDLYGISNAQGGAGRTACPEEDEASEIGSDFVPVAVSDIRRDLDAARQIMHRWSAVRLAESDSSDPCSVPRVRAPTSASTASRQQLLTALAARETAVLPTPLRDTGDARSAHHRRPSHEHMERPLTLEQAKRDSVLRARMLRQRAPTQHTTVATHQPRQRGHEHVARREGNAASTVGIRGQHLATRAALTARAGSAAHGVHHAAQSEQRSAPRADHGKVVPMVRFEPFAL